MLYQKQQLFRSLFSRTLRPIFLSQCPQSFINSPQRSFGVIKYSFEDEPYEPDRFQLSSSSHQTNAEELIHKLPVVMVDGDIARCSGVHQFGLGHPVQYIQLDKKHEFAPAACGYCGLMFKKVAHGGHSAGPHS